MVTPKSQKTANSSRVNEPERLIEQEAIAWFAKMRSGSLSRKDRNSFEHWRTQSSDHKKIFQEVSDMWNDPALLEASRTVTTEPATMPTTSTRWWTPWNWKPWTLPEVGAAAALMVLLMIGAWHLDVLTRIHADYYTTTGEQRTVRLPDQSVMTLNAQSAVAVEFTNATRRIRLIKGKALFDVTSNPDRPFVVAADRLQVQAVGTEFMVGEHVDGLQVTVVEGLVELSDAASSWTPIALPAKTQIDVVNGTPGIIETIDPNVATAWLRGRLVVDTRSLEEVVHAIKPYHAGTILILNADIENLKVSGTYNLSDTQGILSALSQTLPLQTLSVADRVTVFF